MRSVVRRALFALAVSLALLLLAAVPVALHAKTLPVRIPAKGVSLLAFAPDGKLLLAAGEKQPLRVYSVPDGALVREVGAIGEGARSLQFLPDGVRLLSCNAEKELSVLRWPDGKLLLQIALYCDFATVSVHGEVATIGQHRVAVQALAAEIGRLITDSPRGDPPLSLSFSRGGNLLAVARRSGILEIWVPRDKYHETLLAAGTPVSAAFSPREDVLAASRGGSSRISLHAQPRGEVVLDADEEGGGPLVFSPDGSLLLHGRAGEVFSVETKKRVSKGQRSPERDRFHAAALSDEHAAGASEEEILLWRVR